jgi:hypothetical protein
MIQTKQKNQRELVSEHYNKLSKTSTTNPNKTAPNTQETTISVHPRPSYFQCEFYPCGFLTESDLQRHLRVANRSGGAPTGYDHKRWWNEEMSKRRRYE